MSTSARRVTCAGQSTLLIALVSLLAVAPAYAGDCPAGKTGANPLPGAATAPVGVTESAAIERHQHDEAAERDLYRPAQHKDERGQPAQGQPARLTDHDSEEHGGSGH